MWNGEQNLIFLSFLNVLNWVLLNLFFLKCLNFFTKLLLFLGGLLTIGMVPAVNVLQGMFFLN